MPTHYENKIITKKCPSCDRERPLDWFVAESEPCWRCRELSWQLRAGDAEEAKGETKDASARVRGAGALRAR